MGSATAGFKKLHVGVFDEKAEKLLKSLHGKTQKAVL